MSAFQPGQRVKTPDGPGTLSEGPWSSYPNDDPTWLVELDNGDVAEYDEADLREGDQRAYEDYEEELAERLKQERL